MHGPKLPNPANPDKERPVFLFACLDDHTHLAPHAQFYWNEQLPRLTDDPWSSTSTRARSTPPST